MRWLEVIELQSAGSNQELLESHLMALIDEVNKSTPKQAMRSYRHAVIDTDFVIQLCHDSLEAGHNASPLGIRLASALRDFGIVKHSMWFELSGQVPCAHGGREGNDAEHRHSESEEQAERREFK